MMNKFRKIHKKMKIQRVHKFCQTQTQTLKKERDPQLKVNFNLKNHVKIVIVQFCLRQKINRIKIHHLVALDEHLHGQKTIT